MARGADPGSVDDAALVVLAQRIRDEVDRFVGDEGALADGLDRVIDHLRLEERSRVVLAAFDGLGPDERVRLLRDVLGDAAVGELLAGELQHRYARRRSDDAARDQIRRAVHGESIDLTALDEGTRLDLGLYRIDDVDHGVARGSGSEVCARRVELRATRDPGVLRVVRDTYNPRGGLAVTPAYDRSVWESERLDAHLAVEPGSLEAGHVEDGFTGSLHRRARVDVRIGGRVRIGRLHLGDATVGGLDAWP